MIRVRVAFLLLVLANLAFFAWSRYVAPESSGSDRAPLQRQVAPEKLPAVPDAPAPGSAAAAPVTVSAAGTAACLEWGSFTAESAASARNALEPLALGARLAERTVEESAGWWIFIAPQPNRQAAQKKAAELKALGIEEYFIVQEEGRFRWAISLGVFRGEEAAQNRLAALREKGVRSAQVGQRETTVTKTWFQLRDLQPEEQARTRTVASGVPGTELRACPAPSVQRGA